MPSFVRRKCGVVVVHGNKGSTTHNKTPATERKLAIELSKSKYFDFNMTHALEMLRAIAQRKGLRQAIYVDKSDVRLRAGVPTLRSKKAFKVFRDAISGAKQKGLNRLANAGKGPALKDRYDLKRLTTPTQVRNALVYILANASRHFKRAQVFDWFSSFPIFENVEALARLRRDLDWRRRWIEDKQCEVIENMLSPSMGWLARVGWLRAGS